VQGTPQKPALRQIELSLGKLIGLWYLTDELMEDAPALQAEAEDAFRQEITFMAENAFINGAGAGRPLGILNSGAVIQIAIEGGQTLANSSQYISKNLAKMYAAMPPALLDDAVWFINQADILPTIINATMGGTQAQVPVFLPPGMMSSAPYGAILGRPIVPVEYCAAGGTPGDIIFASMSQYLVGERGGIKTAQSIHVQFLTDETTFRITYRVDGQPVWVKALTPYKGSQSLSPYITLAVRT
jgi:HK97 family phage major capsid protein